MGGIIKEKMLEKIKNRLPIDFSKVVLYRNPNEFSTVYIERVNPDHVGILWGRRRKKFNKGTNYIKWGKIYFSILPVTMGLSVTGWLDMLTGYAFNLLASVGLFGLFCICATTVLFWYIPFKMGDIVKCQF